MPGGIYEFIYDPALKSARMELSSYLIGLSVHECVAELKRRIEKLNEELRRHQQAFRSDAVDVSKSLEKMRRLILELELCQQTIPYFQECRHFSPRSLQMVNRLHSAT